MFDDIKTTYSVKLSKIIERAGLRNLTPDINTNKIKVPTPASLRLSARKCKK